MRLTDRLRESPRERLAQQVSAACYGTVLVLGVLVFTNPDQVSSGLGWELVTGIGLATWLAHFYAEVVGEHVTSREPLSRREVRVAMADGLPILLAAIPPATILLLGRLTLMEARTALLIADVVAIVQLVGLGTLVGSMPPRDPARAWLFAFFTVLLGVAVVLLRGVLKH